MIINNILLLKYRIWPILLKKIQYIKKKANILLLQILPYNKSKISEIIDILRKLI